MTTLEYTMRTTPSRGLIEGTCAHCSTKVYESLAVLDDAYAVWVGVCPHCDARNVLGPPGRGYRSNGMQLVLPTKEEIEWNKWPKTWPTEPKQPDRPVDATNQQEQPNVE